MNVITPPEDPRLKARFNVPRAFLDYLVAKTVAVENGYVKDRNNGSLYMLYALFYESQPREDKSVAQFSADRLVQVAFSSQWSLDDSRKLKPQ